jgi:hypothetical protein
LRGHSLQRHHGHGAGFFGDDSLFGGGDVHYYAAFEHFGKAGFQAKAGGITVVLRHIDSLFAIVFSLIARLGAQMR